MTYFPKTAYWRNLYPNCESVDKTTNLQFKNTRVPPVAGFDEGYDSDG